MGCKWHSKHKRVQCNCERHYKKLRKFVFGQLRLQWQTQHDMQHGGAKTFIKAGCTNFRRMQPVFCPVTSRRHTADMIRWRRTSREMCCVIKDHMSLFWKGGKKDESLPSENVSILGKCHKLHTDKWRNPKGRHKNLLNVATIKNNSSMEWLFENFTII